MNYTPQPIDTTQVTLPPELTALTERLSENAHELWAEGGIVPEDKLAALAQECNELTAIFVNIIKNSKDGES